MYEIIIIIALSLILIIFLRRLPEVKVEQSEIFLEKKIDALNNTADENFGEDFNELMVKAEEFFAQKNYQLAEKLYLKLVTLNPNIAKIYGRLGVIYLEDKNFEDARDSFLEAIKKEPKNGFWFNNVGLAFLGYGDFEKAIKAFSRAVKTDPFIPDRYINLGMAYEQIKEYKNALSAYEKALQIEPGKMEYQKKMDDIEKKMAIT